MNISNEQLSNHFSILSLTINQLIKNNSNITPNQVYENLIRLGLIDPNSKSMKINFGEAQSLDKIHFGTEGTRWLCAFSRPMEGSTIEFEGSKCYVANCGIFTFDLYFIDEDEYF